ncbi:hypothetical protein BT96DRAFT_295780 [Gymnopus androsaceus JB14]|uniref:Uncharacterized protein n=1 Tax=Gymnopus androsaceus JB14 TaxID=1447944 RepID=A0A6A4I641_9AGAR|nr:hypothetical protein BT96DRAFT_295780 [Gymnopus androsaceus JB14]
MILDSIPCNIPEGDGVPLRESFKNARVRFNHFAQGGDDSAMTSSAAWAAYTRGVAFAGWRSQEIADLMVPILMDDKIAEHTISAIFVQIKLRHDKASPQKTRDMDEAKLRFFPPKGVDRSNKRVDQRPYITLFLDLGVGVRTYLPPRLVVKKMDAGAASIKGTTTTNADPAVVAIQPSARKTSRLQLDPRPHLRYAFHVRDVRAMSTRSLQVRTTTLIKVCFRIGTCFTRPLDQIWRMQLMNSNLNGDVGRRAGPGLKMTILTRRWIAVATRN